ncbi:MAG: n-acetylglucosaminyl phosphatidylinositol deacetylase, partial [bacterium]
CLPGKGDTTLSESEHLDVLAFAPHPDDLELCCGGTLIRLADGGNRVGLVDLTRGERGTRGTPELRQVEAEAARRILGVRQRTNLGFPDQGIDARNAIQLRRVVETIRRHRPRLVLTSSEHDHHPDHVEAAHLVEKAAYLAGLAGFEADGAPFRPGLTLFYMGRVVFEPKLIVDISEAFDRRVRAAACYQSQFFREADDPRVTPISEPGFFDDVAARLRHFGNRIGVRYGEPFDAREPFGVTDVGALVPGGTP